MRCIFSRVERKGEREKEIREERKEKERMNEKGKGEHLAINFFISVNFILFLSVKKTSGFVLTQEYPCNTRIMSCLLVYY